MAQVRVRVLTNAEDLAGDCKLRCTAFIAHSTYMYIHMYCMYCIYHYTYLYAHAYLYCTYKVRCVVTAKEQHFLLLVHCVVFGRLQAYFVAFCINVILHFCIVFCSYNFVFMVRLI